MFDTFSIDESGVDSSRSWQMMPPSCVLSFLFIINICPFYETTWKESQSGEISAPFCILYLLELYKMCNHPLNDVNNSCSKIIA